MRFQKETIYGFILETISTFDSNTGNPRNKAHVVFIGIRIVGTQRVPCVHI